MVKSSDVIPNLNPPPPLRSGVVATNQSLDAKETVARVFRDRRDSEPAPVVEIRPYMAADIPAVLRLPGTLRLDFPDSLIAGDRGPLDLAAVLPLLRRKRPTFVAVAAGQPIGFVRFSPQRPDGRWILSSIAASTGVYAPEPVWDALVNYGVRIAGLRGVRRLFARVPVEHPLLESLRAIGWTPYARERVFRADRLLMRTAPEPDLRPQELADTWAIHQLYAAVAPRKVQEVEALTSHIWHMEPPNRRRRQRHAGWVVDRDGRLAGYARYTRGTDAGMVGIVVAQGDSGMFGALLDAALAGASRKHRPIYATLRGYQSEFEAVLGDRGFVELGEQELLIRYTTALAKAPAHEPIMFPVELRPALPRRVPTFLEGQPMDGMA